MTVSVVRTLLRRRPPRRWAGIALASVLAVSVGVAPLLPAFGQGVPAFVRGANLSGDMLLEADQLVYDYDVEVVSAVGNVKVYYSGYTLEADRLTYDQRTGRLIATGRPERLTRPGQPDLLSGPRPRGRARRPA